MFFHRYGLACLALCGALGCTNGTTWALRTADLANGGSSGAQSGNRADPRAGSGAGAGGVGGSAAATLFCPTLYGDGDADSEDGLLRELNRAIDDGVFCLDKRVTSSNDLRCGARLLAAQIIMSTPDPGSDRRRGAPVPPGFMVPAGWWQSWSDPSRDAPSVAWTWSTHGATTVAEAKTALLADERTEFCDSARRVTYKWVGIARLMDTWALTLSTD